MHTLIQDLRFSLRLLAKSPGFTATALLTLALALGANSAVFSLVSAALLQPMVPSQSGEVVNLFTASQDAEHHYRRFSLAEYETLRAADTVFADVVAVAKAQAGISATRHEGLSRNLVLLTTENYFSLLGATPALGRFFTAEETRPNAHLPVVVASYNLWQRLGGRSDFVGRTLWVNGQACTVVGVTRANFSGGSIVVAPELWLPLGMFAQIGSAFGRTGGEADLTKPGNQPLLLAGRLLPGLTVATVQPRLPALARQLTDLQPVKAAAPRELQVTPLSRLGITSEPIDDGQLALLAAPLLFMAGSVLLIACLNLANMLLARGTARAKEIALRLALGAGRGRIVQQLLVEGLVLALAGGTIGLLFSVWANHALIAALTGTLEGLTNATLTLQPHLGGAVLGLTFAACVVATLLFSLAPALRASRRDVVAELKAVDARAGGGARWNRFFAGRHLLVMAQIALSVVLLSSAGLFLHSALTAGAVPLGFDPRNGLVTEFDFSLRNVTPAAAQRRLDTVLAQVNAFPGVVRAAVTTQAPMASTETDRRVQPAGAADDAPPGPEAIFSGITPGYFTTLGVPLLRGRDFTAGECRDATAPQVAIIDTSLARKLFPGGDALGRHLRYTGGPTGEATGEWEIVGIVGEHRHETLRVEPSYRLFVPLVHAYTGRVYLQTRLSDSRRDRILAALAQLRAELQRIDPNLPVLRHEPFTDFIRRDTSLWGARLGAVVFGLFGAVALLLSVMGVYSVKAYAVACRTREIGIRVAIGARPADVLSLILKQGAQQIAFAAGVGLIFAILVGQSLASLLYNISPADPLALGGAISVLGGATLLACFLPARRATKVSPMTALRSE